MSAVSAPLPAPVSFTGLTAPFNAPHMKLIRVSAHKGGPGSQQCADCMAQGPFTVRERGVISNLIGLVSWKLCRYLRIMLLTRPPSVRLLYRLLGWHISSPVCSPKLYFFFVCSQHELNRISRQTFLTPVAFSDRFISLLQFFALVPTFSLGLRRTMCVCVCVCGWMDGWMDGSPLQQRLIKAGWKTQLAPWF